MTSLVNLVCFHFFLTHMTPVKTSCKIVSFSHKCIQEVFDLLLQSIHAQNFQVEFRKQVQQVHSIFFN